MTWQLTFKVARYKPGEPPRTDTFQIELDPERTILDGVEKIWAEQDRTLTFRHACHHASCGSCAIMANDVEVLPCIVEVNQVTRNGGTIEVGPLHNFPVVSDLVVDMGTFFERMQQVGMPIIGPTDPLDNQPKDDFHAYENCIECGICLSACPVVATDPTYLGPAALAAAYRQYHNSDDSEEKQRIMNLVDRENGIWRCHVAYECTAACPSNVDPAGKIMGLRRQATVNRVRKLFGLKPA
ncbi:MAG: succinate dehydrogenase/fumarate reductase iron-sulfur subunit [Chloroflexi bacterium]|nr:succinate dehydrogenase/fumarate reductase iron-sulfur subunit [Chloroflexota bacterium]